MQKVLVVEDTENIRILLDYILKTEYEVHLASCGEEGLTMAREHCPEIILLDLGLPDISGYDFCTQIKTYPELATIPIIVLSAKHGPNARALAYKLGADNYLEKPFERTELLALIENKLSQKKKNTQTVMAMGNLKIDQLSQNILINDEIIKTTPKEFKIISFFFGPFK